MELVWFILFDIGLICCLIEDDEVSRSHRKFIHLQVEMGLGFR